MTTVNKPKALVIGVGPERGLGGVLCKRFAEEGHHVFIAGRSSEKIEKVAMVIRDQGGTATPVICDATKENEVIELFDAVERADNESEAKADLTNSDSAGGGLDLVVYNVGNSRPGNIRDMDADFFEESWRILCLGGFLVGRECARRMLPAGGTLIYTGASASLRGKSGFAAFNSGKAALRTFAQALAKEYGGEGLHVGHVIIDGGIAGDKWFSRLDKEPDDEQLKRFISLQGLADAYWNLYLQSPQAWTFELDLRTSIEDW